MFTAIKNAASPILSNMVTGASVAAGAVVGIGLMKGLGDLISKGARRVDFELKQRKYEKAQEKREREVTMSAAG